MFLSDISSRRSYPSGHRILCVHRSSNRFLPYIRGFKRYHTEKLEVDIVVHANLGLGDTRSENGDVIAVRIYYTLVARADWHFNYAILFNSPELKTRQGPQTPHVLRRVATRLLSPQPLDLERRRALPQVSQKTDAPLTFYVFIHYGCNPVFRF